MSDSPSKPDLSEIREKLSESRGPEYWRCLDELSETDAFRELVAQEFPVGAETWVDPVSRRRFIQLMGASLALAGAGACTRQPPETIVPYVRQPEDIVPGTPVHYATAVAAGGYARGVLVECHEGRPTKVEGNPEHPASLGATDATTQAEILDLYDPDRSQVLVHRGRIRPWSAFVAAAGAVASRANAHRGEGLRFLTGTVTSPTLGAQLLELQREMPKARWHQWDAIGRDEVKRGSLAAFGEVLDTRYRFDRARVLLSLDADLLAEGPEALRHAREIARARKVTSGGHEEMLRHYAVESSPTITGAKADHRLGLRPSETAAFAFALARELGLDDVAELEKPLASATAQWAREVAADLKAHAGAGVIAVGDSQPAAVHALVHRINAELGNVGKTLVYSDPVEVDPVIGADSLAELLEDVDAGKVETLVVLGGNPAYDAPADYEFSRRIGAVGQVIRLGLYDDETSALADWHVPEAHAFESWGDLRAADGTVSIQQPLIAPLYGGKTAIELVAMLRGAPASAHDLVRAHWSEAGLSVDFDLDWRRWLHDGVVPGTALAARTVEPGSMELSAPAAVKGLELSFRAHPYLRDGRHANNGWLQELPGALTKLTWDNAALISPSTAQRLHVSDGVVVALRAGGRSVEAPVLVQPAQPDDTVTVHLGYGRTRSGRVGQGVGFDAGAVRRADALWWIDGLEVEATGGSHVLARTQSHHLMEGRHLVREAALAEFREDPEFAHHVAHEFPPEMTMFPPHPYEGHAWAMTIDLAACTGCNACVVACQSENNIAVVGKTEVERGRELHWLRIDRYFKGDGENPEAAVFQPVPCMQCENAPCEVVCPVGATVHSDEGLNDMAYNRCVGTRYCSNNCPYKVRRFNFFKYSDLETPSLKLMRNPDVTVRTRGVMEKCTYCVQRINQARIVARREDRSIADGEITTACQGACPTEAITFGDRNDPESRVSKQKADPRNYSILAELNTRPRTTYIAAVRNPNPQLEAPRAKKAGHGHSGGHH